MRNFKLKFSGFNIILAAIIALAAVLRLYDIEGYMIFLGDEGRDALAVYNILHGDLTLLGPTSSVGGFFLGPIYYYFSVPFMLMSGFSPVGPSIMVALFGIATVYLIYKIGKDFFNEKVGLLAAFLYAISPSAITSSRSSWNPNIVPFFTIVTLYSLYAALEKKSSKLLILTGVFFGVLMQLHYLATFVAVIIFAYVLFWNRSQILKNLKKIIKQYLLIFAGFLISFSPFILFEIRHGFINSLNIINFIFNSSDTGAGSQIFENIYRVFLRLFGGIVFNFPLEAKFPQFHPNIVSVWMIFAIILGICSILLLVVQTKRLTKTRSDIFYFRALIIFWLFLGTFLFGFYKKPIYDYYLQFMYPLPFLLTSSLVYEVWKYKSKIPVLKVTSVLIVCIIVLTSIVFSPLRTAPNHQLKQAKFISDFVLSKTSDKPFNFALISGGNSDHAFRYFFKRADRDPVTILSPQVDPGRKSITSQLLVICDTLPCGPLGHSLWEVAGFGRAEIAEQWKVSVVEVYKLVPYKGE